MPVHDFLRNPAEGYNGTERLSAKTCFELHTSFLVLTHTCRHVLGAHGRLQESAHVVLLRTQDASEFRDRGGGGLTVQHSLVVYRLGYHARRTNPGATKRRPGEKVGETVAKQNEGGQGKGRGRGRGLYPHDTVPNTL